MSEDHGTLGTPYKSMSIHLSLLAALNPIALRTAKILWSFVHSECNRVKEV